MTIETAKGVIQLLQDIEKRSLKFASGLPQNEEDKRFWEGVLFVAAGSNAIAPLHEVKEILNFPSALTKVPGTKNWMLGIANIRGNLLPIVDLQLFLGGIPTVIGRRSRVFIVNHQGLFTGLLVGQVQGMRHFSDKQAVQPPSLPGAIRQYVQHAYELDGSVWPVFSMNLLAESSGFRVAAA